GLQPVVHRGPRALLGEVGGKNRPGPVEITRERKSLGSFGLGWPYVGHECPTHKEEERSLDYATRRAKLQRDTKNRVAPLGMTAGRRAARLRRTGPTAAGETQTPFGRMAIPGWNPRFRSGHEQGFGVLLGDHQEFERGLARAAGALLPTAHGVGAHVQEGG